MCNSENSNEQHLQIESVDDDFSSVQSDKSIPQKKKKTKKYKTNNASVSFSKSGPGESNADFSEISKYYSTIKSKVKPNKNDKRKSMLVPTCTISS